MKKLYLILIFLLFIACNHKDIFFNVRNNMKGKTEINISDYTKFDWKKLYVFTPYTPDEEILNLVKMSKFKLKNINLDMRDDINLLVFTNKDKIVKISEVKRFNIDFSERKKGYLIVGKEEAIFKFNIRMNWIYLYKED